MPKSKPKARRPSFAKASKGKQNSPLRKSLFRSLLSPQTTRSILGLLFVILGFVFLFTVPTIPQKNDDGREPIVAAKEFSKSKKESQITRIIFPKRDIDLEVKSAKIVKGYWQTSENTASHGEGTANPGESGNVVIFAHAREGLFYNLKDAKKDDVIYVFTKDKWYRYKISEIKTVYPNNIETVAPANSEILTLYTCSGFFDEKRLIVKALPM